MTTPPLAQVPVRSAAELTRRWADLLDPPGSAARSLWLMWLGPDGRSLPVIVPIDDVPRLPDVGLTDGLLTLHDSVVEGRPEDGHLALALCRPGPPAITEDDDEWADALRDTFDQQIEGTWSLHLAPGGLVVPLQDAPPWAFRHRPAP